MSALRVSFRAWSRRDVHYICNKLPAILASQQTRSLTTRVLMQVHARIMTATSLPVVSQSRLAVCRNKSTQRASEKNKENPHFLFTITFIYHAYMVSSIQCNSFIEIG